MQRVTTLVCIDPGHGGHDPGAQGKLCRKGFSTAMSKALKREFPSLGAGFTSFLTRTRDYKIKLEDRPKICDRANSDLFIFAHELIYSTNERFWKYFICRTSGVGGKYAT